MNGQSAAKCLKDNISYGKCSTTMPRKGSRLLEIIAETPDIKMHLLFQKYTPFVNKKISCIYMILSEDLQRIYVGSTKDIVKRLQKHRNLLKTNSHHSRHMQGYYNQGNILYFSILEETSELEERELFWITKLTPEFNSTYDTHTIFREPSFIEKYTVPFAKKQRKKIYVFDTLGNFISEYESVTEAAIAFNVSRSNIKLSCKSNTCTCRGHVFSFDNIFRYEKPLKGTQNPELKSKIIKKASKSIRRSDGTVYSSVVEAEIKNNFPRNTLRYFIKNKRLRDGHLYEYIV